MAVGRWWSAALGMFLAGSWASACATGGGSSTHVANPPSHALGENCDHNEDCVSGYCLVTQSSTGFEVKFCSAACTSDADCATSRRTLTCGTPPDGSASCVPACNSGLDDGYACDNGRSVACARVDHTFCADCPCPSDTPICEPGVGCFPKRDVGGPCSANADCKTDNCSEFAHVCRIPVGQACNSVDNCDLCMSLASGWSYCSRECSDDSDCNGGLCLGNSNYYTCRQPCSSLADPSCPSVCQYSSGYSEIYCDCPDCKATSSPRALGVRCAYSSECASGECYVTSRCSSNCGLCTETCTTTADCGAGQTCVNVPCAANETTTCGLKCLPSCSSDTNCEAGSCRTRTSAEATSASVCDVKLGDGAACISDADCMSERCVASACAAANGADNGAACLVSTDCRSANCNNGVCKGTALIGDGCIATYDCAAGQCCNGICSSTC